MNVVDEFVCHNTQELGAKYDDENACRERELQRNNHRGQEYVDIKILEKIHKHAALGIKFVKLLVEHVVCLLLHEPTKVIDELPGACREKRLGKGVTVQRIEENKPNICVVSWHQESINHYAHHN